VICVLIFRAAARDCAERRSSYRSVGWLEWREDTRSFAPITDRAGAIQAIFKMADAGLGQHAIAKRLNADGVPTFGGLGNQRKADAWHRSYVKKLLTNSAVVGIFTPHQRRKDAQGNYRRVPLDPVENYFPVIIERDLYERVASRARATGARGRHAAVEPKSVFAGLLKCAHCGGTVTRMVKGARDVYLICSRANRRVGCKYQAVRYRDVERALRDNAKVIVEEAPRGHRRPRG
jgi:Recombinase/Recombinase zinc beta ribbon domain